MLYLVFIEAALLSAGWFIRAQEFTQFQYLVPVLILLKTIFVGVVSYRIRNSYCKLTYALKLNQSEKLNRSNTRNIISIITAASLLMWGAFWILSVYLVLEIYTFSTKKMIAKIAY